VFPHYDSDFDPESLKVVPLGFHGRTIKIGIKNRNPDAVLSNDINYRCILGDSTSHFYGPDKFYPRETLSVIDLGS
jgi:hypothetical protein